MSDLANNTDTIEMAEVFTVKERTRTAPSLNPDQALVPRDQDNDFDTGQLHSLQGIKGTEISGAMRSGNIQQSGADGTVETKSQPAAEGTTTPPAIPVMDLDNGIVGWESQKDPKMPLNFTPSHKWLVVALLSTLTFMTMFASSILAPTITAMARDYKEHSLTKVSMPVSIFLLGYAVGPLFLSPLSEIYGRHVVLVAANASFCAWLLACALAPSLNTLIFFRFMCGIGGSACQTIGGGVIADMFPLEQRGRAMSIWAMGPMFGPSIAPLIGGYTTETIGWKWTNWISFIPATIAVLLMSIFSRETNAIVLMQRKTRKLRKELGLRQLRSCYVNIYTPARSRRQILLHGLVRPLKMLFRSVIIFGVSLYIAFAYGCLYLLFNTIPLVFQSNYDWSLGTTGLVYLTVVIGYVAGLVIFSTMSDKTVVRMTAANGGIAEPEMRLPTCIWSALLLPVTFFWYGWSADKQIHWIVPVIGIVPFGTALIGIWLPMQTYIVDAYPQYAASGLAAFSVLRNVIAAFLPLAGPDMYASLGVGWGTSVLGFIAIILIPVPVLIYNYGGLLRKKFPLEL